tara:strand:- start:165 stop:542 length:378 start_codon:yes stop_codon:yes gene_type:complete
MKIWIGIGGILGGLSVMLGAFGAHSLKSHLPPEKLTAFQTATHYMSVHALAILLVGLLSLQLGATYENRLKKVEIFFITGILMFCGSIYILSLGGPKLFGPITPLGGLSFMIGWFKLAWIFLKKN